MFKSKQILRISSVFSLVFIVVSSFYVFFPKKVQADPFLISHDRRIWITDEPVESVVFSANERTISIGGDFARIGAYTGRGVSLDAISAQSPTSFPTISGGDVLVSISDGRGGWYIGGTFSKVGDKIVNKLAHINSDGILDASWNPDITGKGIYSMLLNSTSDILYVGGNFSKVGNQTRNNFAAINLITGLAITWGPDISGSIGIDETSVNAITMNIATTTLYIGGLFNSVGGQTRNNIAAVDVHSGQVTSWSPSVNNASTSGSAFVKTLTINQALGVIYIGGFFNSVGGQSRSNLAAVDLTTGVPTLWEPKTNGVVLTAVLNKVELPHLIYIGGDFTTVGNGQVRNRLASVDINTGQIGSWDPNVDGPVYTLVSDYTRNIVYVGGSFGHIGGQERHNMATLDNNTGSAVFWNTGFDEAVRSISFNLLNRRLYVGGEFNNFTGKMRNKIASLETTSGNLTDWDPNSAGGTTLVLNPSTKLTYVTSGGASLNGKAKFAAINSSNGSVTTWNIDETNPVISLAADLRKNVIYVGDNFVGFISPADPVPTPPPAPSTPVVPVNPVVPPVNKFIFTRDLSLGMDNDDVRELQKYLNKNNFSVAASNHGSQGNESTYFGSLTRAALTRFQNVNKTQLGITQGTGYFGPITRLFVNK